MKGRHTRFTKTLRSLLHKRNDGKCQYCGVVTVLPVNGSAIQSANSATIDHVYASWDLRSKVKGGEHLAVLACYKCNNDRNTREKCVLSDKSYSTLYPPFDIRELLTN